MNTQQTNKSQLRINPLHSNDSLYTKTTLDGGLRIVSEELSSVRSFAMGLFVRAGSRNDLPSKSGTAHFVEHTTFRKTASYDFRQLAEQFESMGAFFNAYTTKEVTCYFVRAMSAHFAKCLELLTEIAFRPLFRTQDIEKERQIIIEEIKSAEDDIEELSFDLADRLLFGSNSHAMPIIGSKDSVNSVTKSDLISFFNNYYSSPNSLIAVAGNIPHKQIISCMSEFTANLPDKKSEQYTSEPPESKAPKHKIYKKHTQQVHDLLCKKVDGFNTEHRYLLSLINIIFGDGMSSRLNQSIREKHGLGYNIYSSLQQYSDYGTFYIYNAVPPKHLNQAHDLVVKEIEKLIKKGIKIDELNRAKEQLKTAILLDLESMSARMEALAKYELLHNENEDVETALAAIDAHSPDEINQYIRSIFTIDSWSRLTVIPAK